MFRVIFSFYLYFIIVPEFSVSAQRLPAQSIHWYYSIDSAKTEANLRHENIFLYFSGSDWCKPCIKLREIAINSDVFTHFAKNNLVMLQADFPRLKKNRLTEQQTKRNEMLAEQYNKEGVFPLIVILDSDGNLVAKSGYREEGSEEFVRRIQTLLVKNEK